VVKGISIPVASDTREFASGVQKGVIKPLEGVDKALDEVARGGDAAGDKLEHSLDGARKQTSNFKRDQQDLGKVIATTQRDGTAAIALNSGQRNKISRTAVKQAGAAAKISLAGDLAAIDGSAQGALGAIGNTAGGILASFGPIGAGIGVAVGVATGLIAGMLQKGTERTKKFKEEVSKLGTRFIEVGHTGADSLQPVVDKLKELATTTEDGVVTLQKLKDLTDTNGVSFEDAAVAYAGNEAALKRVIKENKTYIDGLYDQRDAEFTTSNNGDIITGYDKKIEKAEQLGTFLADTKTKINEAAKAEKLYTESGAPEMEEKARRVKSVNDAYDDLLGGIDKFIDKEGKLNPRKFLKDFEKRRKALEDFNTDVDALGFTAEQIEVINGMGTEQSAAFVAGYKKAKPKQKKELAAILTETAKDNSGDYLAAAQKGLNSKTLKAPKVAMPKIDATMFLRDVQSDLDSRPPLKIRGEIVDRAGKKIG